MVIYGCFYIYPSWYQHPFVHRSCWLENLSQRTVEPGSLTEWVQIYIICEL